METIQMPVQLVNAIATYLSTCPFKDVAALMQGMQSVVDKQKEINESHQARPNDSNGA